MGQELVQYEHMRTAVMTCVKVDEAKDIRDKALALAAYARQRDDTELEVWTSEIKLRACTRIGELSIELEKAQFADGPKTAPRLPASGQTKATTLKDAGISTSTANRYEDLTGGRDQRGKDAARAAAENHFARARQEQKPATMEGLRASIKDAVVRTLGPPPVIHRVPAPPPPPAPNMNLTFFGAAIRQLSELSETVNAYFLAEEVNPVLAQTYFEQARATARLVGEFIQMLERRFPDGEEGEDARTG